MSDWSSPAARTVLASGAPREAWLEERRNGIGGSDVEIAYRQAEWADFEVRVLRGADR